jgi:hypothetical protein
MSPPLNTPAPVLGALDRPAIVRVSAYSPDGDPTTLSVERDTFAALRAAGNLDSASLSAMLRHASRRLAAAGAFVGGNWSHQVAEVVAREVGYSGPIVARPLRVKPRKPKAQKAQKSALGPWDNHPEQAWMDGASNPSADSTAPAGAQGQQ